MSKLHAQDIVWVSEQIIRSAGLAFVEQPLYRQEHGPRSGLMDVSNAEAIDAGLFLTGAEDTISAVQNWLSGKEIASPPRSISGGGACQQE